MERPDIAEPVPLLVFLHGAGERGDGDAAADRKLVKKHGPWRTAGRHRMAILAPQCPKGRTWPEMTKAVISACKEAISQHNMDNSRVYLTGLSMGAFGIWAAAYAQPDIFAAVVPVCGGFSKPIPRHSGTGVTKLVRTAKVAPNSREVQRVAHLPSWLFHGGADRIVNVNGSRALYEALGGQARGRDELRLTIYENDGHHIWGKAYRTEELWTWLLSCRRKAGIVYAALSASSTESESNLDGQVIRRRSGTPLPRGSSSSLTETEEASMLNSDDEDLGGVCRRPRSSSSDPEEDDEYQENFGGEPGFRWQRNRARTVERACGQAAYRNIEADMASSSGAGATTGPAKAGAAPERLSSVMAPFRQGDRGTEDPRADKRLRR